MNLQNTLAAPLAETLWRRPNSASAARLREVALVLGGVALLTLSAKTQLPMIPVPMTMQSAAVLLIAAGFGLRLGLATLLAYLVVGFIGAPVFAGPAAGPLYFAGPTGGFLAGFALAAVAVGALADRGWTSGRKLLASLTLGSLIPFATGALWLAALVGVPQAIAAGVLPFLPGAVLKLALAFLLLTAARRATG
jgi:biotin transport system substrate-specific component